MKKIEVWTSTQNHQEVHLFEECARNKYIMGYNPAVIDDHTVVLTLAKSGVIGFGDVGLMCEQLKKARSEWMQHPASNAKKTTPATGPAETAP